MRFRGFREMVGEDAKGFIRKDLAGCMKDLFAGLKRINFEDNFETFTATIKLEAGEQGYITNVLQSPPSKRIIVRQKGNGLITDGTAWNSDKVSLLNNGAEEVTVTVLFMR